MIRLARGLAVWVGLVRALMIRETRVRFAGGAVGYLWAFVTPIAWIGVIVLSFDWLDRVPAIPVEIHAFVATGMLPYMVFRQTVTSMARASAGARSVVHLGPFGMAEVLFAAALLELLNSIVVFALIFALIAVLYQATVPADPLLAVQAVALAALCGATFGRLAAMIGQASDAATRLVPILLRPLFWVSGIFFVAADLPRWAADLLWWNPLLHLSEMLRAGFFAGFRSDLAEPGYVVLLAGIFWTLSLGCEGWLRQRAVTP
jgi:capsular polysaccharide transport system permease protein